jgi:hypothetical protein
MHLGLRALMTHVCAHPITPEDIAHRSQHSSALPISLTVVTIT